MGQWAPVGPPFQETGSGATNASHWDALLLGFDLSRHACRRAYEILKRQQQEEEARREEEEALLDLLRAELAAERARVAAEQRRRRQEEMRREMVEANEVQKRLKVGVGGDGGGLAAGRKQ